MRVPQEGLAGNVRLPESLVTLPRERTQPVDGTGGIRGQDLFAYAADDKPVAHKAKSCTGRSRAPAA